MSDDQAPMTTLSELLAAVREQYIDVFRRAIADMAVDVDRDAESPSFVAEPVLRDGGGEAVREGLLNAPVRADIVVLGDEPQGISVDSEQILEFDPVAARGPNGLEIAFDPFVWDMLEMTLDGLPARADWSPLTEWFDRWFDLHDENPVDEDGLSGVIHGLTDPVPDEETDGLTLTIDLGTAPVEALEELIDVAAALGATGCRFSSPHETMDEDEAAAEGENWEGAE